MTHDQDVTDIELSLYGHGNQVIDRMAREIRRRREAIHRFAESTIVQVAADCDHEHGGEECGATCYLFGAIT